MNAHGSKLADLTRKRISKLTPTELDDTLREAIRIAATRALNKRERMLLRPIIGELIGDTAGFPYGIRKRWLTTMLRRGYGPEDAENLVSRAVIEIVAIANVQLLGDNENQVRMTLQQSGYFLPPQTTFRLLDRSDSMAIAGFCLMSFYKLPPSSYQERPVDPGDLDAVIEAVGQFRSTEAAVMEKRIELQQLLRNLSARRADIIVARHVFGARVGEIAAQLAVSAETVRRELRAGERQLQELSVTA